MRNMPQNKLAKLKSYNISVLARTQEGTDHRYKRFLKMEKVSKTWKQNWGVENKCGQIIISLKKCKKMREKQVGYHVQLRTPRSREQCKLMGKSGEVHPKKWGGAPRRGRDGWQNWEQEKSKTANSDKSIYQKDGPQLMTFFGSLPNLVSSWHIFMSVIGQIFWWKKTSE